jgi:hypothetical protein
MVGPNGGSFDAFVLRLNGADLSTETQTTSNRSLVSDLSVRLFPNPTSTIVHLQFPSASDGSVTILDATGRVRWQQSFSGPAWELPFANLEAGAYWVRISTNEGIAWRRVVKQ